MIHICQVISLVPSSGRQQIHFNWKSIAMENRIMEDTRQRRNSHITELKAWKETSSRKQALSCPVQVHAEREAMWERDETKRTCSWRSAVHTCLFLLHWSNRTLKEMKLSGNQITQLWFLQCVISLYRAKKTQPNKAITGLKEGQEPEEWGICPTFGPRLFVYITRWYHELV